jgi:hypothetical protein
VDPRGQERILPDLIQLGVTVPPPLVLRDLPGRNLSQQKLLVLPAALTLVLLPAPLDQILSQQKLPVLPAALTLVLVPVAGRQAARWEWPYRPQAA